MPAAKLDDQPAMSAGAVAKEDAGYYANQMDPAIHGPQSYRKNY
jgi:hypothetical protein